MKINGDGGERANLERLALDLQIDDMERMIRIERPDVVHVTTPAHTHAALGMRGLSNGCHVYIEKPFTVDADEADEVLAVAESSGRQVCVGHDQLFDPMWIKCRQQVAGGEIGEVVHVESVLGYPLSGQFGAQVAADPNHWVRRLPGGLFQNTISHPPYRITDFLSDHNPHIRADWISRNGFDFPTDLRVEFLGTEATGSLVFDTRIQSQRVTRVYGTRGCLVVDFDAQIIHPTNRRGSRARLENWNAPVQNCARRQGLWPAICRGSCGAICITSPACGICSSVFCECISTGGEPPIPSTEIRRVTRLMDTIFEQCQASEETTDTSVNTPSDDVRHAPGIMTV